MRKLLLCSTLFLSGILAAQTGPEITSWILNPTNATGYNSIPSNIQIVQYSATQVYVSCTCIPGYDIGPWPGLPASQVPVNENFVYKITRNPQQNTGTPVNIGGGHIGVWTNGVSIFNAQDAYSWNNQNIWHRDAVYFEGSTFDTCLGHPSPFGEYHTHLNPRCLYNDADSSVHSPIIGYSFDGFPVYGAYAYADTNGTGPITRMRSSYRLRNITTRDTLPDGTGLSASQQGPPVSATYPLGYFLEDYEYVPGYGDLDAHNGRWCVTPEYPNGTYAYFVTIKPDLSPAFPYVIYGTYYGVVPPGNTGPSGGHNTITESTTIYNPTGIGEIGNSLFKVKCTPNPVTDYAFLYIDPSTSTNNITGNLYNSRGQIVNTYTNLQPSISYTIDFINYPPGIYLLILESGDVRVTQKIIRAK